MTSRQFHRWKLVTTESVLSIHYNVMQRSFKVLATFFSLLCFISKRRIRILCKSNYLAHSTVTVAAWWLGGWTPDRALLNTKASPCRLGKGNFLSQWVSPARCINGSRYCYHPGKKSNNLSSSRYETLDLVTTLPYHLQQAYWSSWGLSLIMEIGVNQQFYSWGAKKSSSP